MKKSYVMIHVIKHDMDPNSNINYRRKIGPMYNDFGCGPNIYFMQFLLIQQSKANDLSAASLGSAPCQGIRVNGY